MTESPDSNSNSDEETLKEALESRLQTLKHSRTLAAEQLHPDMAQKTEILIEIESIGIDAQIDYLESLLADDTAKAVGSKTELPTDVLPDWIGGMPTNYKHIRESFGLALRAEGVDMETINDVVGVVDEAVVNHEDHLVWPENVTRSIDPSSKTFEVDIVWANGSGTDTNVVAFWTTDDDTLVTEYADGETEQYPYGNVVGSRIEDDPANDSSIDDLVSINDHTIHIEDPQSPDEYFIVEPEGVPESEYRDAVVLDYYYGRPVLYLHEPDKEDPEFMIALPTEDDPQIRPIHIREVTNDENAEIVKKGQSVE